jgi:adenylate cyclase
MTASILRAVRALASCGIAEGDPDSLRAQKVVLTLSASLITMLSFAWVGTYLALGLTVAAAIPFTYQLASVVSLVIFARTKSYRFFRDSQAAMMLVLPFLLQWTLGGFAPSSAVSLWALVTAIGTLFFFTASGSVPWFIAFVTLTVISGIIDSSLSAHAASIPRNIRTAFFVLNITGVALTAYAMLQYAVRARDQAFAESESLLLNVLPRSIAERLKRDRGVIAESHPAVTVLFADVVDFTPFAERTEPERVVGFLDTIFSAFDHLAEKHGLEKIKTIGDAYMVASGLPDERPDHAEAMAEMALDMQDAIAALGQELGLPLALRVGLHSGPVTAGVIGRHKFIYDLWGDTVNTASRMESHGIPGRIQVTETTYRILRDCYSFEKRGVIDVKGKGPMPTYLLVGRMPDGPATPGLRPD